MNKYRELEREEFIQFLSKYMKGVSAISDKYKLECGRGGYLHILGLLTTSMKFINTDGEWRNKELKLEFGYTVNEIFIAGLGMIEIVHNPAFDMSKSKEMSVEIFGGLPTSSYGFELFKTLEFPFTFLCKSSVLVELPKPTLFERFKVWFKNLFI